MSQRYAYALDNQNCWFERFRPKRHNEHKQCAVELPPDDAVRVVVFSRDAVHDLGTQRTVGEALLLLVFVMEHLCGAEPDFPDAVLQASKWFDEPDTPVAWRTLLPYRPKNESYGGALIRADGIVAHVCDLDAGAEWTMEQYWQIDQACPAREDQEDDDDCMEVMPPSKAARRTELAKTMRHRCEMLRSHQQCATAMQRWHRGSVSDVAGLTLCTTDSEQTHWQRIEEAHQRCAQKLGETLLELNMLHEQTLALHKRLHDDQ